ncbi:MAG: homoserine kinase [Sulfolobales archaeon]
MVRVRARSYCSSANLGSGFDVVAVALDAYYDEVEVEVVRGGSGSVVLESVGGVFAELVDRDINTSVAAAKELLKFVGVDNVDVSIRLWKGIPPSAGLGGSGASAVATIKAVMTALDLELSHNEIIEIAGRAEAVVAGEPHYDNVSASLLGGLVFVLSSNPVNVIRFNVYANFVVATPMVRMPPNKTAIMRSVLPKQVELKEVVRNYGRLVALVAGLLSGNFKIAGYGMEDYIVEPARAAYIPCYESVKKSALDSGAYGLAISGAGPSLLALCEDEDIARRVLKAIEDSYRRHGVEALVKIAHTGPATEVLTLD